MYKSPSVNSALFTLFVPLLMGLFVSVLPAEVNAQVRYKTLTRGKSVSIRASSCSLRLTTNSTSRVRAGCIGRRTSRSPASTSSRLYLRGGQLSTIFARQCFLVVRSSSKSKIDVRCESKRPTPTSTVTPVGTSTPTASPTATPTNTPTPNANALLTNNRIVAFNTEFPAGAQTPIALTGVATDDAIVSIDRRPINGSLYGLGYNASIGVVTLYRISPESGVAVAIGTPSSFTDGTTSVRVGVNSATQIGIDFNPVVDRLRVVTSNGPSSVGQNFRVNPNTGALVDGDLGGSAESVSGTNMDGSINGLTSSVGETAYTNNQNPTSVTTQYTIDSATDSLYIQNPPNGGLQTSAVPLSRAIDSVAGFDIQPLVNTETSNSAVTSGSAYAIVKFVGSAQQSFVRIELTSGQITELGSIGSAPVGPTPTGTPAQDYLGIAVQKPLTTNIIGLSSDGGTLYNFSSLTPEQVTNTSVSGVSSGEALVGIDFRPSTGQLFGLGINASTDTGSLYQIDPLSGAATIVGGTSGLVSFVTDSAVAVDFPSSGYGFNFNPSVDRIRIVTSSGLNFRINPATGTPVDGDLGGAAGSVTGVNTDGAINGLVTSVQATSYTDSFAQSPSLVTTQYTVDATSNSLYIQNSPNSGTQTSQRVLSLSGLPLNITGVDGFEIPSSVKGTAANAPVQSGEAFAALTVSSATSLYRIDLTNGNARLLGNIGNGGLGLSGLAVAETAAY